MSIISVFKAVTSSLALFYCQDPAFMLRRGPEVKDSLVRHQEGQGPVVPCCRQSLDNLKVISEADLDAVLPAEGQATVIVATPISQAVPRPVEDDPGDNDQIQLRNRHRWAEPGLENAKSPRRQSVKARDLDEFEGLATDPRVNQSLPRGQDLPGYGLRVHLVVDRTVKGHAISLQQASGA